MKISSQKYRLTSSHKVIKVLKAFLDFQKSGISSKIITMTEENNNNKLPEEQNKIGFKTNFPEVRKAEKYS